MAHSAATSIAFWASRLGATAALVALLGVGVVSADHRRDHVTTRANDGEAATEWTAVSVTGNAAFRNPSIPPEPWQTISEGTTLGAPFELRTGSEARLTLERGADSIEVDPDSRAEIRATDGRNPATRVLQTLGRLLFRVDGGRARAFEVETPYLIAGVKGTVFSVAVTTGGTTVSVSEGIVSVSRPGSFVRTVELRAGQSGSVASSPDATISVTETGEPPAGPDSETGGEGSTPDAGEGGDQGARQGSGQRGGRGGGQDRGPGGVQSVGQGGGESGGQGGGQGGGSG